MPDNLIDRLSVNSRESIPLVSNNRLNDSNWQIAGVPLGDGSFWIYQDRNAEIAFGDDSIDIDIPRFSHSHDQVQIFDNPKQLYLTKREYNPGPGGITGFSARMKAGVINGNLDDFRDGFCAFNVLDFSTAMVFDIISNGNKIWAVCERLLIPGLTTAEQAFTHVMPIDRATSPDDLLHCTVIYDRQRDSAEYYIDDKLIYRAENIPVKIDKLQTGFGIITLHPIVNGKSVSCKGQGARGAWTGFSVYKA